MPHFSCIFPNESVPFYVYTAFSLLTFLPLHLRMSFFCCTFAPVIQNQLFTFKILML